MNSRSEFAPDSQASWIRLSIGMAIAILGNAGMWSVVVVLPAVQQEFGVDRAAASFPYSSTMLGFALGNVLAGKAVDRWGLSMPMALSGGVLGAGYLLASTSTSIWQFALTQGLLIGLSASIFFGPFLADISHYFQKRRGIAVALAASSNYWAGALWPFYIEPILREASWRDAYWNMGLICCGVIVPTTWFLRQGTEQRQAQASAKAQYLHPASTEWTSGQVQLLLIVAGVACCVAMSMPQVHVVALCADLGYGVAVGTEMLSLMLSCGILSRLLSGMLADRVGGVRTLLLGSCLQCLALLFYLPTEGLTSLYLVSALFGLSQGGIIPSYTLIIREYLPAREAGARVGLVVMATILGMALGGWLSGKIFDWTGSYQAAFLNGIGWNLINITLIGFLLLRSSRNQPVPAR